MLLTYQTVKMYGEHEIIVQKSRFISYFERVTSEQEAQNFINKIKKQNWNATHNCSAYIIGEQDHIQKANDDGEPSGTAGVPMLDVLKKRELKDTAVVVTRYFGGIKLGAGGLIRAYSGAVSQGLDSVGIVCRTLHQLIDTTLDYHWLGKVENELRQSSYILNEIEYTGQVKISTFVQTTNVEAFIDWMTGLTNGQATFTKGRQLYVEEDC